MALLQRARASGRCPPSLLTESRISPGDGFEIAVTKVMEMNGMALASHGQVASDFSAALKMADHGASGASKEALEFRRCILLAIVGSTNIESPSMRAVLDSGYLSAVKVWYDQILQGSVGGVDLLLHLLSNIIELPVTKLLVKQSGMGKAIGSIEKHSICAGTPNQAAIMDRVHKIKAAWNASVKARKDKQAPSPKRQIDPSILGASPPPKKPKVEEKKKANAFSSLLKKVSDSTPTKGASSSAHSTPNRSPGASKSGVLNDTPRSRKAKRVKWADHFGGNLTASRLLDTSESPAESAKVDDSKVSWTDRKKRDRLKEKELLAKAKKAKIMDDDNDIQTVSRIKPTMSWRIPSLLPENPEVTKAQLDSNEAGTQTEREKKVQRVRYMSDDQVPSSPAPLSDVEQALDMTSVASAVVATIPFFVPQASAPAPAVAAAPAAIPAAPYSQPPSHVPAPPSAPPPAAYAPQPQSAHEAATAQTVQSLGLPMFLVGQNVQALQTLASSPSLLSTLVDANGMYDQPRLMSLVQTLSQNVAPQPPPPAGQIGGLPGYQPPAPAPAPPSYGSQSYPPSSGGGIYGPASTPASASPYGPAGSSFGGGGGFPGGGPRNGGYRGDNNSDGNLHVSGYGPSTTQADIITLFAPFVKVDEVVMKGTFSFVNTSDAMGAKQARETLNGAMLGGMPVRINMAQRRSRDPNFPAGGAGAGAGGFGGGGGGPPRGPDMSKPPGMGQRNDMPPFQQKPPQPFGDQPVPQDVRDDRGNPATKNLFVAGYGPGTTEVQLREVFGQYATIVGVVTKGTFSFVNTSDKISAIRAREALSSSVINGGVLRINFAKETGRLGTSFDLTYGPGASGGGGSHYGRGGY